MAVLLIVVDPAERSSLIWYPAQESGNLIAVAVAGEVLSKLVLKLPVSKGKSNFRPERTKTILS